jgi:hypothetical protein
MGTLTIYRTHFLEDDIVDGDFPRDDTTMDVYSNVTAKEAADVLIREGLSFDATGNDWAADPDGSYVTNYATGQRCEISGHLSDFDPRLVAAIIRRVG